MRKLSLIAVGLFVAGLVLLVAGLFTGDAEFYLVLIFPVVKSSGPLPIAGLLLMVCAFFIWFASLFSMAGSPGQADGRDASGQGEAPGAPGQVNEPETVRPGRVGARPRTKVGGVVFLGPIPVVFSNDGVLGKKIAVLASAIGIFILIIMILLIIM